VNDSDLIRVLVTVLGILVIMAIRAGWRALTAAPDPEEVRRRVEAQNEVEEVARAYVERSMLQIWQTFPDASDEQTAILTHDRLVNQRVTERAAYLWCTAATAGRLRRTVLLELARERKQGRE
jgi:hypothetical protein